MLRNKIWKAFSKFCAYAFASMVLASIATAFMFLMSGLGYGIYYTFKSICEVIL